MIWLPPLGPLPHKFTTPHFSDGRDPEGNTPMKPSPDFNPQSQFPPIRLSICHVARSHDLLGTHTRSDRRIALRDIEGRSPGPEA